MASAVLNNRNEFMGKLPFSKSNPNPKRNYHEPAGGINGYQNVESPAMAQSASDDASSINRRSNEFVPSQYVRFNIALYSRKELVDLKNRLTYELERIRRLNNRIETNEFQVRSSYDSVPPAKKSINKKLSGHKRPFPSSFPKDSKRLNPDNANLIKLCGQILTKLVKHKHAWIFKTPVDVVGDGLHDYYDIIKNPMDLGTVKSNLAKNLYSSPLDFASDVRLTFNNAMLYNPKGHDVYAMAEQLLARFEELFRPVNEKLVVEEPQERVYDEELQENSWNPPTAVPERENAMHIERKMEQTPAIASNPPSVQSVRTPSPMRMPAVKPVKQPKPKAKDPNKREMSMEEKHRLGTGLQSLPQEKMEQVVQIISKRNGHLSQDGDEIELDIETVDTETLWELDRFVTNYKKWVSKMKRQELMGINMNPIERNVELPETERIEIASEAKKQKKGDVGDEDVDIGDDIPVSNFPPVEIEKDDGRASGSSSSSSSSSSGSSSSSDSDSGSSSGSDSDADDARS